MIVYYNIDVFWNKYLVSWNLILFMLRVIKIDSLFYLFFGWFEYYLINN